MADLSPSALGRADAFAATLDVALGRLNADYADQQCGGFGMLPPMVRLVPLNTFVTWMRRRGKLGGQNKGPRVINDPALLAELDGFAREA